jgi:hypothetical protein
MRTTTRPRGTKPGAVALAVSTLVTAALLVGHTSVGAAPSPPPSGNRPAGAAPAPHIITQFANGLKGAHKVLPRVPVPVPLGNDIDGCNHDYGEPGQCVPRHLPPGQTNWCSYLASHRLAHVKVHGRDSLGLDPGHIGLTCS